MPEPLVAAGLVRRAFDRLCALGIDREALQAEAGLTPATLSITRLRLAASVLGDLMEAAERLTGDQRIGFHLATRYEPTGLTLPELMFFATGTIGDAIRRVHPVLRLFGDAEVWTAHEGGQRWSYVMRAPWRRAHVHLHEHGVALPLAAIRAATGVTMAPVVVRFTHARTGDLSAYEEWFGCPVQFGAGRTEVELRPEQLAIPLATGNPLFASHFEREAAAELATLTAGRTVGDRLREFLEAELDALRLAESSLESAAIRLRVSARTLQRGLAAEGTTFAQTLDAVRRAAGERMLLAGMDIAEVSWRLGYAEPPVFHRAFKRWTGETPERFRARSA